MESLNQILDTITFDIRKKTEENIKLDSRNDLIIQHNKLVEARYRLSLQEKRIILWLLTQISSDDEDFKPHRLEINEFARMVGLKPKGQYKELQYITANLMKRAIKIHELENQEILQVSWLSSARYQIKKGCVLLEFSPQLKPYLLQLKSHFTKLSLSDMMQLTSIYSMRFYELLKQYEIVGQRKISVKEIREYCGIVEGEYKRYNDFKKDVLERAKKEINGKTDIIINYTEIKESRKIVAIEWTIKKKDLEEQKHSEKIAHAEKELRSEQIIINSLLEYGFGKITSKSLIKLHGKEAVKNAVRAVNLQVERGKVKNPKAMLKVAIEEKWHPEVFNIGKKSAQN